MPTPIAPAEPRGAVVHFPRSDGLPEVRGRSASAPFVSRPARRSLHVSACSFARLPEATLYTGELEPLRRLHDPPDCYRPEQPRRTGLSPARSTTPFKAYPNCQTTVKYYTKFGLSGNRETWHLPGNLATHIAHHRLASHNAKENNGFRFSSSSILHPRGSAARLKNSPHVDRPRCRSDRCDYRGGDT